MADEKIKLETPPMCDCPRRFSDKAGIRIRNRGAVHSYACESEQLRVGCRCVIDTQQGKELGCVVTRSVSAVGSAQRFRLKNILRRADEGDIEIFSKLTEREKEAYRYCMDRIRERALDMKLVAVDYCYDGSKAVFFFTADGRVDFRELVKDLAQRFHTRIELRQIGVRDEARMVGGVGPCGYALCCAIYLKEFAPVSIKMAKKQNLSLNPSKISGICGRLMCCLTYESHDDAK